MTEIVLSIAADRLSTRKVAELRRLIDNYPGTEEVVLQLLPPGDTVGLSARRLQLKERVDGSAEFLTEAMGLL